MNRVFVKKRFTECGFGHTFTFPKDFTAIIKSMISIVHFTVTAFDRAREGMAL
jgi:hypothetical protein